MMMVIWNLRMYQLAFAVQQKPLNHTSLASNWLTMMVVVSMRNVPHRVGPLNTWPPIDVLIWGSYGGASLLHGL